MSASRSNAGAPQLDAPPQNSLRTLLWIPVVALAAWLLVTLLLRATHRTAPPGAPMPALVAEGWLNGVPPDDLAGKVVVLDFWGSYCGPCMELAPELVELHAKYRDRGVVFVGFSTEDESQHAKMVRFIDRFGIGWPNGYGAYRIASALRVEYIPATFVFGPDGRMVWNSDSAGSLEDGINQALALVKS